MEDLMEDLKAPVIQACNYSGPQAVLLLEAAQVNRERQNGRHRMKRQSQRRRWWWRQPLLWMPRGNISSKNGRRELRLRSLSCKMASRSCEERRIIIRVGTSRHCAASFCSLSSWHRLDSQCVLPLMSSPVSSRSMPVMLRYTFYRVVRISFACRGASELHFSRYRFVSWQRWYEIYYSIRFYPFFIVCLSCLSVSLSVYLHSSCNFLLKSRHS